MTLKLVQFNSDLCDVWDAFVMGESNGTFLHTRKYLSYHLDRYQDASYLVYKSNKIVGVIPIASTKNNSDLAISHPGISFGGLIHDGKLLGNLMSKTFQLLTKELRKCGYSTFRYKSIPYIYNTFPAQDDIYFLHQKGATLSRCDLSTTISIKNQLPLSKKRVKSSEKFGGNFEIRDSFSLIQDFWDILVENLSKRHESSPTHTIAEIKQLQEWFPNQIQLLTLFLEDSCIAGLVLYKSRVVWHIQYMSSSEVGRAQQGLDLLIQTAIKYAQESEIAFLDFGHSNEDNGHYFNDGLYNFKSKFGGGGVPLFEFSYEL